MPEMRSYFETQINRRDLTNRLTAPLPGADMFSKEKRCAAGLRLRCATAEQERSRETRHNHATIIGVVRGRQGAIPTRIASSFCYFVLWEAMSQTKYCCSLRVKVFATQKKFWAGYAADCNVVPKRKLVFP